MVRGKMANLGETALIFGVAENTVRRWAAKGCPVLDKAGPGGEWKFSTADVSAWLVAQRKGSGSDEGVVDLETARTRKMVAEAELAEIEAARARGDVVPVDVVAKIIGDQIAACRARLFAIPAGMATVVVSAQDVVEVQSLLTAAVREAAEELIGYVAGSSEAARDEFEDGAGEGVGGEHEAAAGPDGEPMGGPLPEAFTGGLERARSMDHSQE
jgi:phage terminase Nu1 subunit (DNA packaging protein)